MSFILLTLPLSLSFLVPISFFALVSLFSIALFVGCVCLGVFLLKLLIKIDYSFDNDIFFSYCLKVLV